MKVLRNLSLLGCLLSSLQIYASNETKFDFLDDLSWYQEIQNSVGGADPNAEDASGLSPLHVAVGFMGSDREKVKLANVLIARGALQTHDHEGRFPLHLALRNQRVGDTLEVLELLVDHGADVNIPDHNGLTPLLTTIVEGIRAINEDSTSRTAHTPSFSFSMTEKTKELISFLVQRGAKLEIDLNALKKALGEGFETHSFFQAIQQYIAEISPSAVNVSENEPSQHNNTSSSSASSPDPLNSLRSNYAII
jgi:ankyrin repeat protein